MTLCNRNLDVITFITEGLPIPILVLVPVRDQGPGATAQDRDQLDHGPDQDQVLEQLELILSKSNIGPFIPGTRYLVFYPGNVEGVPTNERNRLNHKGTWCKYKSILCQEGYCNECCIPEEADIVGTQALEGEKSTLETEYWTVGWNW